MEADALRLLQANCPNLVRVLNEFGSALLNQYQDYLVYNGTSYNERPHWNREQERHIASGKLFNTADFIVEQGGTRFQVSMKLADYWKNIEFGTKPHMPPYESILEWIKIKPVIPRPYRSLKEAVKADDLPTPEELATMICNSIADNGTLGSHDLKAALEGLTKEYTDKILEAAAQDFGDILFMEFNALDSERVEV